MKNVIFTTLDKALPKDERLLNKTIKNSANSINKILVDLEKKSNVQLMTNEIKFEIPKKYIVKEEEVISKKTLNPFDIMYRIANNSNTKPWVKYKPPKFLERVEKKKAERNYKLIAINQINKEAKDLNQYARNIKTADISIPNNHVNQRNKSSGNEKSLKNSFRKLKDNESIINQTENSPCNNNHENKLLSTNYNSFLKGSKAFDKNKIKSKNIINYSNMSNYQNIHNSNFNSTFITDKPIVKQNNENNSIFAARKKLSTDYSFINTKYNTLPELKEVKEALRNTLLAGMKESDNLLNFQNKQHLNNQTNLKNQNTKKSKDDLIDVNEYLVFNSKSKDSNDNSKTCFSKTHFNFRRTFNHKTHTKNKSDIQEFDLKIKKDFQKTYNSFFESENYNVLDSAYKIRNKYSNPNKKYDQFSDIEEIIKNNTEGCYVSQNIKVMELKNILQNIKLKARRQSTKKHREYRSLPKPKLLKKEDPKLKEMKMRIWRKKKELLDLESDKVENAKYQREHELSANYDYCSDIMIAQEIRELNKELNTMGAYIFEKGKKMKLIPIFDRICKVYDNVNKINDGASFRLKQFIEQRFDVQLKGKEIFNYKPLKWENYKDTESKKLEYREQLKNFSFIKMRNLFQEAIQKHIEIDEEIKEIYNKFFK